MKQFLKRCLCIALPVMLYISAQSQSLQKLEYFFDTDPGIGNGIMITLPVQSTIDSTFTFDVSSLSDGLHTIFIRTQDAGMNWSLNYATSFIKTSGSDTVLNITRLEYFIDTDPGFGNGTPLSIITANIIDSTFDLLIPDNGADKRYLGIRAMDTYGRWSLVYSDSVSMCELYRSKPGFSWIRYGSNFSFVDSSLNNPTHKLLWKFGNLGTDSVSNPQFTFPQGNYSTTLISGAGCRKDSITLPLFVGLEKYYPDTALAGGNVAMAFFGGGLDTTAVITISNASGIINPVSKLKVDPMLTMALFDFHTATPGNYDVHIHFPSGYDTTINNGMKLIAAPGGVTYEPDININFSGPTSARRGSTVKVDMIISNNGGMLAEQVPISFTISRDGMGLLGDYSYKVNYLPPPSPVMPYEDSLPHYSNLDSLYDQPYQGRMQNFIIPFLNAGESFVMPVYLYIPMNAPENSITEITAWSGDRILGSPLREHWGECTDAIVDEVVGFIPVVSCANGLFNYFTYGSKSVGEWAWSVAGIALSCVPGGTIAKAVSESKIIVQLLEHPKAFAEIIHNGVSGLRESLEACKEVEKWDREKIRKQHHRTAVDPNEIDGPEGYTANNYISGTGKQVYHIGFENLPTATANAQRVFVIDTLDKSKFDLNTFELLSYSIGDTTFPIPLQRKEYTQTADLTLSTGLQVRFNAKLDTATGILNCSFLSIDPDTRDTLPAADLRGFLPPDTDDISGKASVTYGVLMKNDLVTNDEIRNTASIVFDYNAPIITNTWLNTIDKTAPTGFISGGTIINDTTVRLSFSGSDAESGLKGNYLYISENQKPYVKVGPVFGDTLQFVGSLDSIYHFYSVPYDSAYNVLDKSPAAEYSITFTQQGPLPVTLVSFTAQKQQNNVQCNWQTTSEINFSHYVVERSLDGNHFETAGIVTAQGGIGIKKYQFTDASAIKRFSDNKKLFYRLRMVDIDNTSKYSRIVRLDFDKKYTVVVYPNPASSEIYVDGIQHYRSLQITDISGRIVISEAVSPNRQSINISTLNDGVYTLRLSGDDDVQSIRFIKQSIR